jgi:hypothetical protein
MELPEKFSEMLRDYEVLEKNTKKTRILTGKYIDEPESKFKVQVTEPQGRLRYYPADNFLPRIVIDSRGAVYPSTTADILDYIEGTGGSSIDADEAVSKLEPLVLVLEAEYNASKTNQNDLGTMEEVISLLRKMIELKYPYIYDHWNDKLPDKLEKSTEYIYTLKLKDIFGEIYDLWLRWSGRPG